MANKIIFDARPTAQTLFATDGAIKDLGNGLATTASAEVENGTALNTHADFMLYLHDFDSAPDAGGYFELHILYQMDTVYGDGEDGDLADPNLSAATQVGVFPVFAGDEDQYIQLIGVPLAPHDFKVILRNRTGDDVANSDGSFLKIYPYSLEVQ